MTELDLTQVLPSLPTGDPAFRCPLVRTHKAADSNEVATSKATIADLLACLAALPADAQVAVATKLVESMNDEMARKFHRLCNRRIDEANELASRARSLEAELAKVKARAEELESIRQAAVAALREGQLAIAPEWVSAVEAGGVLAASVDDALVALGDEPRRGPKPPEER